MAIPYPADSRQPEGILELEQISENLFKGFFMPPPDAIAGHKQNPKQYRKCILEIDSSLKTIAMVPFRVWGMSPMSYRYAKLEEICIEITGYAERYLEENWDLEDLITMAIPEIFTQDINYGFGFKRHYSGIATILEQLDIRKLTVSKHVKTNIDPTNHTATIHRNDLDNLRRSVDTIIRRSGILVSELKRDILITGLYAALGSTDVNVKSAGKISKDEFVRLVKKTNRFAKNGATPAEQKEALTVIRNNAGKIFKEQRQELIKLKNDLELVNLEQLILRFESMIEAKVGEGQWQSLFLKNPFIINMAFGIPVVSVQGQASVGGKKLSGGGEKIADFLVKNSLSSNTAIVEIKTPATALVNGKAYRGGVHGPSMELGAAVSQVLDQVYQLQKEINSIKGNSRIYDIETYHVQGILIVGVTPTGTDEQKSFEYFRANSKNVQVITFDELLEKLKSLHQFLSPDPPSTLSPSTGDEEVLPF